MIQSEEITDKLAHINATNIGEKIDPQGGESVREVIQNNLRAVEEQSRRLGRPIVPHLNHPNLNNTGISAEELAARRARRARELGREPQGFDAGTGAWLDRIANHGDHHPPLRV